MPPKKKKGKGKKKKGSAKGSAAGSRAASAVDDGPVSEARKEFYMIQIKDLERKKERQELKAKELEDANKEFKDQYDQMSKDKHDIVTFLKRTLQERIDEVADLTDRLSALQQDKDQEKEAYEETIKSMKAEFQETKDNLSTENMNLQRALAGLEEFKIQREELMRKFANLEEDSRKLQEEHQEQMYKLERKAVVDKDRLKKEMVLKVNQVAAEFRKVSNKQMADTTKRTIRENASINSQLTKMSDKTMDMLQEIDELRAKEKQHRQQKQLLETNEKELAKKIHSSQKVIRLLTEKSKETEVLLAEFEAREMEYQQMQSEAHLIRTQNEAMKQELQKISRELDNKEEEVADLEQSLGEETKAKRNLEQLILDTAASMHGALKGPAPDDPDFETLLEQREKRDGMLEHILAMLNSAAALGIGPDPGRLGKTTADTFKTKTSFLPAVGMGLKKGTVTMSPFSTPEGTVAHYQLGDLGLVPKPREAMMASMAQSVGGLSHTTSRLGAVRNPRRVRSVGVQTASAQRAMFFADQLLKSPVKGLDFPQKITETSFTQQRKKVR
ncbi:cilia- and flagella-associated protein 157-like [Branchiostoma lanceolatum]|uniref:cilia- and flagella-associated protein 157-like n=1 Tax=Branchiostoma lanceolatum TaxID=7740 RepID=UPI0034563DB8